MSVCVYTAINTAIYSMTLNGIASQPRIELKGIDNNLLC